MTVLNDMDKIYSTDPDTDDASYRSHWYQQKPYAIVFTSRAGETDTFYLPIAPSNLNIVTHWATNVISTMYGTVEEHSEQRYYDITIVGTTGISPRYYKPLGYQRTPSEGRLGFPVKSLIPGEAGGFAKRTQALAQNAINNASDLILGREAPSTGVNSYQTGYVAFHNLYKFLLNYKKDASGENSIRRRSGHPLKFVNFKDNNEYDVAITGFQLSRDANNPMLYNYNITMRAYNLRSADSYDIELDIKDRSKDLGLDGIKTSFFAQMANKVSQAKNAAYSAIAFAKGFGK